MWSTQVAHAVAPRLDLGLTLEELQHDVGVVDEARLRVSLVRRVDSRRAPRQARLHTLR